MGRRRDRHGKERPAILRRALGAAGIALGIIALCAGPARAAGVYDLVYPESRESAVAEVNGRILTDADAREISAGSMEAKSHGDRGDKKAALRTLVNRELVIQYAVAEGLPTRGAAKEVVDLFRLMTLGMDYYESVVMHNVTIDSDELAGLVPRKWKVGAFDLVLFDTLAAAEAEARRVRTGAEFEELKRKLPKSAKAVEDLYPGSGFFSSFDDLSLYKKKPGEVYGAAETGLGAAVVFVRDVREASPAEVSGIVSKVSDSLKEKGLGKEIERIRATMPFAPDRKAILEYARAAKAGETADVVLCRIGDRTITGSQVRWLVRNEPARYMKSLGPEELVPQYEAVLNNLALWVAMGEESRRNGDDDLSPGRYAGSFNFWKRGYYYSVGLDAGVGEIVVPEAELRKYYDEHLKDKFTNIERVRAAQIFSRENKAVIDNVARRLKEGESFEDLAKQYSEDEQSASKGGVIGWIVRDGSVLPGIEKAAFGRKVGDITPVIKTERGYHILKLLEYRKTEVVPFEKVKDGIYRVLGGKKYTEQQDKFIRGLRSKAKIRTYPQRLKAKKEAG